MCGIVGAFHRGKQNHFAWLTPALESLRSRGPDGASSKCLADGRVILGHTRLAIIDIGARGAQPLCNEDGTVWITFNGEVYNFRELRQRLIGFGHQFRTETDTEVIVHAYEQWGSECVQYLDGIFAFGIWDSNTDQLFLARDHAGVKPLYYTRSHEPFIFASQPKAILCDPCFKRSVSREAFRDYLAFGYVPEPDSIYEGIRRLPPAHTLTVSRKGYDLRRYWQCVYDPKIYSLDEAAEAIAATFETTVKSQLSSDVPVGTLLSGGIDSTYMTALAHRNRNQSHGPLHTFTLGFDELESDERGFAAIAATFYGTKHASAELSAEELLSQLEIVTQAFDEPFDPNGPLPATRIAKLVHDTDIKVVLGGDGADELFAGYLRYDQFSSYKQRNQSLTTRVASIFGLLNRAEDHKQYFSYEGCCDASLLNAIIPGNSANEWCERSIDGLKPYFNHDELTPGVALCQLADFHHYLPGHILTKVDRSTMHYGVEARVPFVGKQMIELGFSISGNINYAQGERKAALKQAARSCLPTALLTGRKKGFSSPMGRWTNSRVKTWAVNKVSGGLLEQMNLIRPEAIAGLADWRNQRNFRPFWLLLMAELWAERWLVSDCNRTPLPEQYAHDAA
jgi:asparagine synthase (glutamine-hydrolysing)